MFSESCAAQALRQTADEQARACRTSFGLASEKRGPKPRWTGTFKFPNRTEPNRCIFKKSGTGTNRTEPVPSWIKRHARWVPSRVNPPLEIKILLEQNPLKSSLSMEIGRTDLSAARDGLQGVSTFWTRERIMFCLKYIEKTETQNIRPINPRIS